MAHRVTPFTVVRVAVGCALLCASLSKCYQMVWESSSRALGSRALFAGAVELEFALGVMLLFGVAPVSTRRISLVCFAGFSGIALYHVLSGASSCGCFGNLEVNPKWMLGFDLFVFASLLSCQPTSAPKCGTDCLHPSK